MKSLHEDAFLQWAAGKGLGLNPKYPQSAVLDFQTESESRFWKVPEEPARRPYFVSSLLELMGGWHSCYAWRHLGSWPDSESIKRSGINAAVELRILAGLGLPLGTADVVEFDRTEVYSLITLLFSTTVFGWSRHEDLYIVPDHAEQIMQTDHHDVIHVSFRNAESVQLWIAQMTERGFHLPTALPDATFKHPSWMPREANPD
jgi:hypothetical protein